MIPFFIDTRVLPNLISRKLCLRNSSRGSSSSNELHLTTGEHSSQYLLASAHLWRHSTNDPRLSAGAVRRAIPATIISVALHSIVQSTYNKDPMKPEIHSSFDTSSLHIITGISVAAVGSNRSHSGEGGSFGYFLGLGRNLLISDSRFMLRFHILLRY